MTWCGDSVREERTLQILSAPHQEEKNLVDYKSNEVRTLTCPNCGHNIEIDQDQTNIHDLLGLPAGVKFDPNDQEILEHLEAKVLSDACKLHPLIDEFIPTIEGENGICYTHPEKLPGIGKDGQIRHFFHRPSKAYTTGTRKRRKVHSDAEGGETRWHKTGKTRPVLVGGEVKGYKKILVLYTNYGRKRKPEKTNWVMHQYHLGHGEEEKDGELVVSKVFFQTQPRQCISSSTAKESSLENRPITIRSSTMDEISRNSTKSTNFVDYYHPHFSPPDQLIPNNWILHGGDASSFTHLPSNASKSK